MLSFIVWMAAFLAAIGLLRLGSGSRSGRFRQALSPLLALAHGAAAHVLYTDSLQPLLLWLEALAAPLKPVLALLGGSPPPAALALLLFNWLVLAGFLIVKLAGKAITALTEALIGLWYRWRPEPGPAAPPELLLSPAYAMDPWAGIVLDPRWAYARRVCLGLAGVAFLQLAAGAFLLLAGSPVAVPALPSLPLLFFLETALYLGGRRRDRLLEAGGLAPEEPSGIAADYAALWERYRKLWPERLLYAGELHPNTGGRGLEATLEAVEQDLEAGRNILVKGNELTPILPALARRSRRLLSEGGVVLILVARDDQAAELVRILTRDPVDPAGEPAARRVADLPCFRKDPDSTDILVATPDALLQGEVLADAWFEKLRLLVIPDLEAAFAAIAVLYGVLCRADSRAGTAPQHVLLSHERHAIQPAVARNLRLDTVEHVLQPAAPGRMWTLVWQAEGEPWLQQVLLSGHLGKHLGSETTLALPAWKSGVEPIRLFGVATVPWLEQREELQNDLGRFRPEWRVDPNRSGLARDRIEVCLNPLAARPEPRGCVVVRDAGANLSTAVANVLGKGTGEILLHVVSPPYMLRDYLAANLEYFLTAPLWALSPRKTVGLFTIADSLWQSLSTAELEETAVLAELHEYDPSIRYAEAGLRRVLLDAYGVDVVRDGLLHLRVESRFDDDAEGAFAEVVLFSITGETGGRTEGPNPALYRLCGENGEVLAVAGQDRFNQLYLPGQVHVFGGRAYRIGRLDPDERTLSLDHCQPRGELCYRRALAVRVAGCHPVDNAEASRHTRHNGLSLVRELCICDFTVATLGYFAAGQDLRLAGAGASYVDLDRDQRHRLPDRRRPTGRGLRLRFELPGEFRDEAPRLACTLAALFSEALPTLLPEIHESVLAGAFLPAGFLTTPDLEKWFPHFIRDPDHGPDSAPEDLEILVLEDARQDTGAIQCLFDKYDVAFEVIYDYLAWAASGNPAPMAGTGKKPFLAYGLDAVPPELDLPTALKFLQRIGLGCGPNSLHANRTAAMGPGQGAIA